MSLEKMQTCIFSKRVDFVDTLNGASFSLPERNAPFRRQIVEKQSTRGREPSV